MTHHLELLGSEEVRLCGQVIAAPPRGLPVGRAGYGSREGHQEERQKTAHRVIRGKLLGLGGSIGRSRIGSRGRAFLFALSTVYGSVEGVEREVRENETKVCHSSLRSAPREKLYSYLSIIY